MDNSTDPNTLDLAKNGPSPLSESLLAGETKEEIIVDEEPPQLEWIRGERQPSNACRDAPFAFLFVAHIATIVGLAIAWGIPSLKMEEEDQDDDDAVGTVRFQGFLYLFAISGAGSLLVSAAVLAFMTKFAKFLLQISVLFSIFASLAVMMMCSFRGYDAGALLAFAVFAVGCCYAFAVWNRIPFAASNLATAITAIRTNLGVVVVPHALGLVSCGYLILWSLAHLGVYTHSATCSENGTCVSQVSGGILALFLLALFWTQQVVKSIIHVTVSGVVGTWWFAPNEASSFCSPSICASFCRCTTTSFGSVCLGSLLVAMVSVVRSMAQQARARGEPGSLLLCIADCLGVMLEKFNKYAFVYVGLYGYTFVESGDKVMRLFYARGWSLIVNDALVHRVLGWTSLVIGGLTGAISMLVIDANPGILGDVPGDGTRSWISFICGFLIGFFIANALMSVVSSAVDCVLVCFAEAPVELRSHHPELSEQMEEAWYATYPQEYHYAVPDENLV